MSAVTSDASIAVAPRKLPGST